MKKPVVLLWTLIMAMAFCIALSEDAALPAEPETFSSGDFEYAILEDGTAEIVQYTGLAKELMIPGALDGKTVTGIGDEAFSWCEFLTSVTIPDSVTSIGRHAFGCCTSLASVMVPDSVTLIGDGAFSGCCSLDSITIPDSVTGIGDWAFWDCRSLTSVMIPNSVANIGANPFGNCKKLTDIIVSPDHPYLATIDGVLFSMPDKRLVCYPYAFAADSYAIPDGIQIIGERAFSSCTTLTSVTLPDSVTSIGDEAFYDCTSLTYVTIPDSVTGIGDEAFCDCSSLTSVTIPDSVTGIGNYVFLACTSLTSVTLPDTMTGIGDFAFACCESLTSIMIPDSVTNIGANPFGKCEKLTDIIVSPDHPYLATIDGVLFSKPDMRLVCYPCAFTADSYVIPDGIRMIGDYAFYDCSSLTSVTIPDSVTSIGEHAFAVYQDDKYGLNPKLTVTVSRDSCAAQYCKDNGVKYTDDAVD